MASPIIKQCCQIFVIEAKASKPNAAVHTFTSDIHIMQYAHACSQLENFDQLDML